MPHILPFLAKIRIIYLKFTKISVKFYIFMQKLKKFLQQLNENCQKAQGFFQKLNLPELLGPAVFQNGVQKKACHRYNNCSMKTYDRLMVWTDDTSP